MKKRKPPVVLASVLVVLLGMVVFINAKSAPQSAPKGPDPAENKPRETASKDDISKRLSSNIAPDTATPGLPAPNKPGMPKPLVKGGPSEQMMQNIPKEAKAHIAKMQENPQSFKPKPNDSSTSTQWYTPETPKSNN